jgi:hypothetical protein
VLMLAARPLAVALCLSPFRIRRRRDRLHFAGRSARRRAIEWKRVRRRSLKL